MAFVCSDGSKVRTRVVVHCAGITSTTRNRAEEKAGRQDVAVDPGEDTSLNGNVTGRQEGITAYLVILSTFSIPFSVSTVETCRFR